MMTDNKQVEVFHSNLHFLCYSLQEKEDWNSGNKRMGNSCPKFNSPDTKTEFKEFSAEIAPECAIPEINFNEEALQIILRRFSVSRNNTKRTKAHLARFVFHFDMTL